MEDKTHTHVSDSLKHQILAQGSDTMHKTKECQGGCSNQQLCVCLVIHSSRLLGSPFAEVGMRKSRPPGSPEGPRCYLLVR